MKFRVKLLPLKTERVSVILNQSDADELGLLPGDRVRVVIGDNSFNAEVEIATEFVEAGEAGICRFTAEVCSIEEPCEAEIYPIPKPKSVEYIRKKFDGQKYEKEEIRSIIADITSNILSEVEMAAFVLSNEILGMDHDELQWMIEAMVEFGEKITFERVNVVDKHSIGGVPGTKAAMVVVPTIAASGLLIPKTASRAITSASGTADTMEVLADVNLSVDEIKEITERVGGVIAWSEAAGIAPADDKIIRVEFQLETTPLPHMIASLLSKKVASGVKFVAIDIPVGEGAKIENLDDARSFAGQFVEIGRRLGVRVGITLTDGSQPIGRSVGPALEAREILSVMEGKRTSKSLIEKSLGIAGILLEMTGVTTNGYEYAKKVFESGKTLEKFREIIEAQGGRGDVKSDDIPVGDKTYTVNAAKSGYVEKINVRAINEIARTAGAPKDKGAGVYVHRKRGEIVKAGDPLLTIYAEKEWKLDAAIEIASNAITVGSVVIQKLYTW